MDLHCFLLKLRMQQTQTDKPSPFMKELMCMMKCATMSTFFASLMSNICNYVDANGNRNTQVSIHVRSGHHVQLCELHPTLSNFFFASSVLL